MVRWPNPSQRKIHGVTTGRGAGCVDHEAQPSTDGRGREASEAIGLESHLTGLRLDDEDAVGRRDPADHGRVRLQLDVELAPGGGERQRSGLVGPTNTCGHLQRGVVEQLGQGGVEAP